MVMTARDSRPTRVLGALTGAIALLTACTHGVAGVAVLPYRETPGPASMLAVDVGTVLLDLPAMRGITGADKDLNIVPSMDSTAPVDIDVLAQGLPKPCRFMFAETATFGNAIADFHKTTYQDPPVGGLISQAAAAYRSTDAAHAALTTLRAAASECAQTSFGQRFVGDVVGDTGSLRIRPGGPCGRDYRVKSVVLAEVTYCSFPESIPELVMTNLLAKVPG